MDSLHCLRASWPMWATAGRARPSRAPSLTWSWPVSGDRGIHSSAAGAAAAQVVSDMGLGPGRATVADRHLVDAAAAAGAAGSGEDGFEEGDTRELESWSAILGAAAVGDSRDSHTGLGYA